MMWNKSVVREQTEKKQSLSLAKKLNKNKDDFLIQAVSILVALLLIAPLIYAVSVSFMERGDILSRDANFFPVHFTLQNYVKAFQQTEVIQYLWNSLIMASVSSLSRVFLATLTAFAFSFYQFRGKNLLFVIVMMTILVPPDILMVSNYVTVSKLGLSNTMLGLCSIFLVSSANILMMRQTFLGFPPALREASQLDGCNDLNFFFRILLPMSAPTITTVFLSSFVAVWNQYLWPLLITNKNEMRTIQVGITMLKSRESTDYGPVMAGVVMAMLPMVLLFAIFQKKIVSGMTAGSVK